MILKIQRPEQKQDLTPSWVIFSDILNAYYVTIDGDHFREIIKDFDGNTSGKYPFDYSAIKGDPDKVVTVEATRKNGSTLYIAFNTCGYLLNDEGKTIERLV